MLIFHSRPLIQCFNVVTIDVMGIVIGFLKQSDTSRSLDFILLVAIQLFDIVLATDSLWVVLMVALL